MIKQLLVYACAFALLFFIVYNIQDYVLKRINIPLNFNLWDIHVFFATASFLICVHIKLFSKLKALHNYLGFIYLPTLFIKGILFFLAFRKTIFSSELLSMTERVNLLIPSLLFLALEVYFIAQILSKKPIKI